MTVLIEPEVQKREAPHLMSFTNFLEDVPLSNKVDFIITLGGDGVRTHTLGFVLCVSVCVCACVCVCV
jgi:NAD kinase